jgi:RHS repeat-associated protein
MWGPKPNILYKREPGFGRGAAKRAGRMGSILNGAKLRRLLARLTSVATTNFETIEKAKLAPFGAGLVFCIVSWRTVGGGGLHETGPDPIAGARVHLWGLDITGTIHGGGGVGGLLLTNEAAVNYFAVNDSNGNVRALLDSSGGIAAAYDYSAFGEVLQAIGPYAASNPFRFASKFQDAESGLYQYNHRFYNATLGRFINRDPVGEHGGLNLYAYCGNDGVNHWDYLGIDLWGLAVVCWF